jgi:hypothetical protein
METKRDNMQIRFSEIGLALQPILAAVACAPAKGKTDTGWPKWKFYLKYFGCSRLGETNLHVY